MKSLAIILLLNYLVFIQAQVPLKNATCDNVCLDKLETFNLNSISGIWYRYATVPYPWQVVQSCTYANITALTDLTGYVSYTQLECKKPKTYNTFVNLTADGSFERLLTPSNVRIKEKIIKATPDYNILFACHECGFYSSEGAGLYAIISTRLVHPPCEVIESALSVLERCGISRDQLTYIDQSNCNICEDLCV